VAAAGIDPSIDGQSEISEICTSSQALHAASCQNESAVQQGLIYSYMQSRRPPQPNRSIGGGLGMAALLRCCWLWLAACCVAAWLVRGWLATSTASALDLCRELRDRLK
jgi:hypothetical protein